MLEKIIRGEMDIRACWNIKSLIEAFAVGLMRSDAYYVGYRLPAGFELIVDNMAFGLEELLSGNLHRGEVVFMTAKEAVDAVRTVAMRDQVFVALGQGPSQYISASDPVRTGPSGIDLDAVFQNMGCALRSQRRESHEAFCSFSRSQAIRKGAGTAYIEDWACRVCGTLGGGVNEADLPPANA